MVQVELNNMYINIGANNGREKLLKKTAISGKLFEALFMFIFFLYKLGRLETHSLICQRMIVFKYAVQFVCLFSWRYNPLWLYFHSPVAGFSLLVFEVS
jgi:hypothetical protein